MKHFLDLIPVEKRAHVSPEVLQWLTYCYRYESLQKYEVLSFYTQACYDAGLINHWQKHCIDYYG